MNTKTNNLVKAGFFIALGIAFPFLFHALNMGGTVFLPMHIPVLLAGFILGWKYGAIIGIITPLLNSLLTGMPPIYPVGIAMTFELCTYGLLAGYLYKSKRINIFASLICAMVGGRLVSGLANYMLFTFFMGKKYLLNMFLTAAVIKPIPGIIIQLIFIPVIVAALVKYERSRG